MKRELLKELGLTDEQIDKIMAENGKDIEKLKSDIASMTGERDGLKTQLAEAGATIDGLKKLDPDALQKAADDWKAKAEQAEAARADQVGKLKFDHALESALKGAKARNAKAVMALLDTSILKLSEDGTIAGLEEQLSKIKGSDEFLFETDEPQLKVVAGGKSKSITDDPFVSALRKGAGLTDKE